MNLKENTTVGVLGLCHSYNPSRHEDVAGNTFGRRHREMETSS